MTRDEAFAKWATIGLPVWARDAAEAASLREAFECGWAAATARAAGIADRITLEYAAWQDGGRPAWAGLPEWVAAEVASAIREGK